MNGIAERISAVDLAKLEGGERDRISERIDGLLDPKLMAGLDEAALSQLFTDAHELMNTERAAYCARLQSMSLKGGKIPQELLDTQEFFRQMERRIDNHHRKFLLSKKAA